MLYTPPSTSTPPPPPFPPLPPLPPLAPILSPVAPFFSGGGGADIAPCSSACLPPRSSSTGMPLDDDHWRSPETVKEPYHYDTSTGLHSITSSSSSGGGGDHGSGETCTGAHLYDAQQQQQRARDAVVPLCNFPGFENRCSAGMACSTEPSISFVETVDPSYWLHHDDQSRGASPLAQQPHQHQHQDQHQHQQHLFQYEDATGTSAEASPWTFCAPLSPSPRRLPADLPRPPLSAPSTQSWFPLLSPSTTPPLYYSPSSPPSSFLPLQPPTTTSMISLAPLASHSSMDLSRLEPPIPHAPVDDDAIITSIPVAGPSVQHRRSRPPCSSHTFPESWLASHHTPSYKLKPRRQVSPPLSHDTHPHHHHRRSHHRRRHHHGKKDKQSTGKKKRRAPVQHRALELPELQYLIGLYLAPRSLAACVRVCRSWWMAYMPLLWNTITGKNGLSPKLTIESLRQYGHLIRTAADISHDRLVQKFYCGQVRHLTELCVDMEHIRQAMVLDAVDSRLWPPEAMDDDGFSTPVLQLINNTDMEDNPHHANHEDIDSLALDDPVSSHHLGQTNSLGQLLRTANYCIDIARRNPSLTRLEWAGLDTDLLWILNTDVYSRLPNLRMLYLKRWQVSQESFEWILQCCPQLEMLVLDHVQCFGVFSDSECYYRHHGLRQMVVYEHAYPFLRHFPDLERLTVNVTDGLNTLQLSDDIRQYCLRMKELEIDGSDPTMNRDIALLIEAVPQLMTLNLYCWFWSSSVVQALLKYHRYTIEVVNASDGAMDREGNLYLNHTLGDEGSSTAATTTMMAAEQDEIQLLLTYCRRLRVFKVPWHGLSTSGVTMQDLHNYGNSDSSYSTDVGQGRHLETLWILIKGMDAALEIQQLMTDLGARLTTAKQRAWIAELERSRELARQELRVSKGAHKDKQVDPYEGGSWDLGQSNDEVDMDVVALPTLPLLPSSRSASPLIDWVLVPRGIELAQEADTDGGYDVCTSDGSYVRGFGSTFTTGIFDGPVPNCSVVSNSTIAALDKRMGDDEEEEQEDEDEEPGSQLEYPGMGPTYTEMVSRPSSHYERLGALLRVYLQRFPRLERLSLGTGEYILPRHDFHSVGGSVP